jgi:hypothetical protein
MYRDLKTKMHKDELIAVMYRCLQKYRHCASTNFGADFWQHIATEVIRVIFIIRVIRVRVIRVIILKPKMTKI